MENRAPIRALKVLERLRQPTINMKRPRPRETNVSGGERLLNAVMVNSKRGNAPTLASTRKLLKTPNYKIYSTRRIGSSASSSNASLFRRYDERRRHRSNAPTAPEKQEAPSAAPPAFVIPPSATTFFGYGIPPTAQPPTNMAVNLRNLGSTRGAFGLDTSMAKYLVPMRNQHIESTLGSVPNAIEVSSAIQRDLMLIDNTLKKRIALGKQRLAKITSDAKGSDPMRGWHHPPTPSLLIDRNSELGVASAELQEQYRRLKMATRDRQFENLRLMEKRSTLLGGSTSPRNPRISDAFFSTQPFPTGRGRHSMSVSEVRYGNRSLSGHYKSSQPQVQSPPPLPTVKIERLTTPRSDYGKAPAGETHRPTDVRASKVNAMSGAAMSGGATREEATRGEARRGEATRGEATRGEARRGEAIRGEATRGEARRGEATRGEARRGEARRGEATRREATRGEATRGEARRGEAIRGEAIRGEAKRGRSLGPLAAEVINERQVRGAVKRGGSLGPVASEAMGEGAMRGGAMRERAKRGELLGPVAAELMGEEAMRGGATRERSKRRESLGSLAAEVMREGVMRVGGMRGGTMRGELLGPVAAEVMREEAMRGGATRERSKRRESLGSLAAEVMREGAMRGGGMRGGAMRGELLGPVAAEVMREGAMRGGAMRERAKRGESLGPVAGEPICERAIRERDKERSKSCLAKSFVSNDTVAKSTVAKSSAARIPVAKASAPKGSSSKISLIKGSGSKGSGPKDGGGGGVSGFANAILAHFKPKSQPAHGAPLRPIPEIQPKSLPNPSQAFGAIPTATSLIAPKTVHPVLGVNQTSRFNRSSYFMPSRKY